MNKFLSRLSLLSSKKKKTLWFVCLKSFRKFKSYLFIIMVPQVIRPALNVLINLVCPPPSISNKPSAIPSSNNAPPVSLPTSDKSTSNPSNTNTSAVTSALVGDRRITLGSGAGCAGLAAQLEQGYRQAREAVRANNGIKVLLNLLNSRVIIPPGTVESIRALACRVLLGLAIDDTIAHILTKLQVFFFLSVFEM